MSQGSPEKPTFIQSIIERTITNGIGYRNHGKEDERPSENVFSLQYDLGNLLIHSIGRAVDIDSLLPGGRERLLDLGRSLDEGSLLGYLFNEEWKDPDLTRVMYANEAFSRLGVQLSVFAELHKFSQEPDWPELSYRESVVMADKLIAKKEGLAQTLKDSYLHDE